MRCNVKKPIRKDFEAFIQFKWETFQRSLSAAFTIVKTFHHVPVQVRILSYCGLCQLFV